MPSELVDAMNQDDFTGDRLAALDGVRGALPDAAAVQGLRRALADRSNLVVAKATEIAGESRDKSLPLLTQLLFQHDSDRCVQAALALAESRLPGTFEALKRAWERRAEMAVRESLLLCIGLLRTPQSREFLLSLIHPTDLQSATDAIKGLKMHGDVEGLREQTEAAVEAIGDAGLRKVFEEEWGRR